MDTPDFIINFSATKQDLIAVQRLRYQVFVEELGGDGPDVDHENRLERDRYDAFASHLIARHVPTDQVVGVYRLMTQEQARAAGQFYSEDEFDLTVLKDSGRRLLELGRSCLHPSFRSGTAMYHLWRALAGYIAENRIEVLFGVASFHGTDMDHLVAPLSLLNSRHLAPRDLRVQVRSDEPAKMIPDALLDRRAAMVGMPALIKAYLRLGGFVGEGAYVDRAFNTTDVCLILDTARMNPRQAALYQGDVR